MLSTLVKANLLGLLRDRVLHAILGVALLILALVPVFSLFSMRQVQELSVTLSLSAISWMLLLLAVLLGASSVWRDIEKGYAVSVLGGLPIPRSTYVLSKWLSISIFMFFCVTGLGLASCVAIVISSSQYPSDLPILWNNIALAVFFDYLKYLLLAAVGILFSTFSTSFFLPVFGTLGIYLAGSASQQVMEYVSGQFGQTLSPLARFFSVVFYYILPNFSAFDYIPYAVYALPLSFYEMCINFIYFSIYTSILLFISMVAFARREIR